MFRIHEGVQVDDTGNVKFNFNYDERDKDIIYTCDSNTKNFDNNLRYFYGYKYTKNATPNQKKLFRRYMKSEDAVWDTDVYEFVDSAVCKLDKIQSLSTFSAFVSTDSNDSYRTLVDLIEIFLNEEITNGPPSYSFRLVKETYSHVKLNQQKLYDALFTHYHGNIKKVDKDFESVVKKFEEYKSEGQLFEMKRWVPREIRTAFTDFLKFKNEEEKEVYKSLDGKDILLYDDFLTSGSTVKEMTRYLNSINPTNTLTVFVLVDQS